MIIYFILIFITTKGSYSVVCSFDKYTGCGIEMYLLPDKLNSIFILHPTLYQSQSNQHRSPVCMHKQTKTPSLIPPSSMHIRVCVCVCSLNSVHISKVCAYVFLVCILPSQSSHTVNSNTASWILLKLLLQQTQPIINKLTRGWGSIIKGPILKKQQNTYYFSHSLLCQRMTVSGFFLSFFSPPR